MKKVNDQFYLAGQINISDLTAIQAAGIKTIINNRPDHEEPDQPSAAQIANAAQQHGIAYHHLPMANNQPLPPTLVTDFKTVLANTNDPVLAHCRSGMRSSLIWALGAIADNTISVDQAIAAVQAVGIPLGNARGILEAVVAD